MSAHRQTQGIDVVLDNLEDETTPHCPHGPALLFERPCDGGKTQKFYACSACRDRKECNFFQKFDARVSETSKLARQEENKKLQPLYSHKEFKERYIKLKEEGNCKFCHTCNLLLVRDEWPEHEVHLVQEDITENQLIFPTKLLMTKESNKSNAQFLFNEETCTFFKNTIQSLGYSKVLCIGAPRLHESIMDESETSKQKNDTLKSFLLDIDHRFLQFYTEKEFCHYNMFNHHFFGGDKSKEMFIKFMLEEAGKVVIVVDPPFGGLVDVLVYTLKKISRLCDDDKTIPVFWIFPYYLEYIIKKKMPSMEMSDYKVNYSNHDSYQEGPKGRKLGSPVRFFTNIDLKSIELPKDNYRWCDICKKYVHKTNLHCEKCNDCPSKDGSQYKHCDLCDHCVKPSRTHCQQCETCVQHDHICNQKSNSGCHICGNDSHKRKVCPKRHQIWAERKKGKKRKQEGLQLAKKIMKKKTR